MGRDHEAGPLERRLGPGFSRLRRQREKAAKDYRRFGFDILMANPPFARDIKQSDMLSPYELAHQTNGKLESAVGRDLRVSLNGTSTSLSPADAWQSCCRRGGFNNSSDQRVREFIMERCRILAVVGLHPNSFKPHTGTKTACCSSRNGTTTLRRGRSARRWATTTSSSRPSACESVNNRGQKVYVREEDGSPRRDTHGHFIVAHDLFNHDGLTKDGIAEAFVEFAKKERLSFFQSEPSTALASRR